MNYETRFADGEVSARNEDIIESDEGVNSHSSNKRNIILGLLIVILLVAAGYYFFSGDSAGIVDSNAGAGVGSGDDSQAPAVTVIIPGSGSVQRIINASGTLAARRELPVGVAGEGGQVSRVLVQPGDWVKTGQILAVIDQSVQSQQARSLAAQIDVAVADANLAQSELDRALQLVERGFISKADIDRKTAARDAAVARVDVARAQLREAQARTGRLNIRAPEAGLVLSRNVEPGQVVGSGTGVLFSLAARGEMELQAEMGESDLSRLSVGVPATVTPVGSEESFTGRVWQILPVIDPQSRQGIARIALPYDPALRPGGFASAEVMSGTSQSPLLPESAVLSDDAGSYVYIVGEDNKVVRREVTTGTVTADGIAITSGLSGQERVVLYAGGFLSPGETVRPTLLKKAAD
jgi:RND family efflux transporter MFP subunit